MTGVQTCALPIYFDDAEYEDGPGKTVSGEPEESPDGDPEEDMPEHMEELIEEMMKDLAEEDDIPGDPDSGGIMMVIDGPEDADTGDEPGGEGGEPASEIEADPDGLSSGSEGDSGLPESETGEDDEATDTDDGSESGSGPDSDGDGDDKGDDDGETGGGTGESTDEDADDESERGEAPDIDKAEDVSKPDEPHRDAPRAEHDIDGGEALHHIDEKSKAFAERDMEAEIEDRYDVKLDEVEKVDERDRARWARLVKTMHEYDLDVEERKRERDDRIEHRQSRYSHKSDRLSDGLKRRAENAGVIRELKEGFQELVSRPLPEPSRRGTRIDPINVSRRAAGDVTVTELFEDEKIVETGERCVGLATDISGSMGSSIDELKIAGAAIGKATDIIGDEFVWEAFTDQPGRGEERLDLRIVTAPNEEFDWEHLDSFGAARNEPTAAGVRDCFQLMQQTDANDYVMIVITDGMALITEDGHDKRGTNIPVEQARQAVNEVRAQGVDVIGLGIGSMSDKKMEETFGGNHYRLTDIDNLAADILDLYKQQMDVVKQR